MQEINENDLGQELKYGEKILKEFDVERDLEIWENKQSRDYKIKITLPEFCCLCPRSGYPDFATIYLEYVPNKFVVELKAIKLYINSFMNKNISHEDSINEIYSVLERKLEPKWMKIVGDFNPRGNVHTVIEISSDEIIKKPEIKEPASTLITPSYEKRERSGDRSDRKPAARTNSRGCSRTKEFDKKPSRERSGSAKKPAKEGFKKPEFLGEKRARVVKKDK
ncbi:preQ(1) synthase [Campylobacter sp. RM16187]|uniref:preQ(1) synthase n=1 Tax=Campylobacter sp. RM16187 TaxID=1660063 RepID=UPI0021B57BDE|nr:preQ(1) synthase [Campylobacter sp. RM16187]QKG28315.1 7-cyano-7-deazaguanine reductase [Campylobacter sp. RM16187]